MSMSLIISYTLYNIFLFYQLLHIKKFRGASQGFLALLNTFALAAMIHAFVFLIYFGYKFSWIGAIGLFCITPLIQPVWFIIEAKIGFKEFALYLSLTGFVVIPICAYFMWLSFPQ